MTNMGTVFGATSGTRVFGSTSTTEDVLAGIDLQGKRILVTGVSAGLGVETARSLAAHGAQVVGAARDLKKADAATALVRKESTAKGGSFELVGLDLANLKSVRDCADHLLESGQPDCFSYPCRWAADQPVFCGSPLLQCGPRGSQL